MNITAEFNKRKVQARYAEAAYSRIDHEKLLNPVENCPCWNCQVENNHDFVDAPDRGYYKHWKDVPDPLVEFCKSMLSRGRYNRKVPMANDYKEHIASGRNKSPAITASVDKEFHPFE